MSFAMLCFSCEFYPKTVERAFQNKITGCVSLRKELVEEKVWENFKREHMEDYLEITRIFETKKRTIKQTRVEAFEYQYHMNLKNYA